MSEPYFNKRLEPIKIKEKSISQLLAEMSRTAYQGRKLGEAVDVWENMLKEKDLTIVKLAVRIDLQQKGVIFVAVITC